MQDKDFSLRVVVTGDPAREFPLSACKMSLKGDPLNGARSGKDGSESPSFFTANAGFFGTNVR